MAKSTSPTDKHNSRSSLDSAEKAILVTGGSGFIGQQLTKTLSSRGRTVVSLYRFNTPESLERVYPVCSDLSSAELMAAPLRGVETVVHLAWEGGLSGPEEPLHFEPNTPAMLTKNLQTTANLISAMEKAGTKRLVFISAFGASANAAARFLQEKYIAELLVVNSRIPERLIVRSGVVWGGMQGKDRFLQSVKRVLRYPLYPVPRSGGKIAPLHVGDLANLISRACDTVLTSELSIVDAIGAESVDAFELLKLVNEKLVKKTRFRLPRFVGESVLPLLEKESSPDRAALPRLRDVLALSSNGGKQETENEKALFQGLFPQSMASFKDRLMD